MQYTKYVLYIKFQECCVRLARWHWKRSGVDCRLYVHVRMRLNCRASLEVYW